MSRPLPRAQRPGERLYWMKALRRPATAAKVCADGQESSERPSSLLKPGVLLDPP
jgi:hypothetical protein